MDTRRLPYLVEFERHGSMRVVAELLGTSTSVVSQQIAALAREVGSPLVEPDGRRSRLTPVGRRLVEHARTITAAVEAAHLDLDPDGEPRGVVRVAGFATVVRQAVLPTVAALRASGSAVVLTVREHEPAEAYGLLAADEVDLALTYDYDLAPAAPDRDLAATPLWSAPWGLAVPTSAALCSVPDAPGVVAAFADHEWIGNSRNPADEQVLRLLASMAGFRPRMVHEADSLDLVEDLILAGLGVGLLPRDRPARDGVTVLPLSAPEVRLRAWAVTRRGRASWPALALVVDRIAAAGTGDHGRAVS